VPKTLVFAKDDSHAEDIVNLIREEFGKGNDFCKKITYRTSGEKPEDLIQSFRNSYNPRIAVTVDMISTGTDIKPLECLIFLRNIKSRVYFEQMKGRGTRTILSDDLKGVTPDAEFKDHFVIVDAVGVCESDKTDSRPLEKKRTVPFDKLLYSIAAGNRDEDALSSLAGRLSRLEQEIPPKAAEEITAAAQGNSLRTIVNQLLDAIDPDKQEEKAQELFNSETPTQEQVREAALNLTQTACLPFDNPQLRETLIDIKRRSEQVIDNISKDEVLFAGSDEKAKERAGNLIQSFKRFIEENKSELTALQLIYSRPYGKRHITYEQIKELAEAIKRPPYNLAPEQLWQAYRQLEKSRVRGAGPQILLTDLISLLSFYMGEVETLEPFSATVERRFENWLTEQEKTGKPFNPEQLEWLKLIKEHIVTSLGIEMKDFELTPFYEKGGPAGVYKLFGNRIYQIMQELNEALAV